MVARPNGATMRVTISAVLCCLALPAGALAQADPGPGQAATPPQGQACGAQAAKYATDKGLAIWVTRRGTMVQENPLRPLTASRFVILQVVVKGRLATAYGPDYGHLQQGYSPRDLEKDGAASISWAEAADDLPDGIQVVADDGRALFGPMRFVSCGEAPLTKVTASPKPAPKAEPSGAARRTAADKPSPRMPQGALPGLSIPKGAVD